MLVLSSKGTHVRTALPLEGIAHHKIFRVWHIEHIMLSEVDYVFVVSGSPFQLKKPFIPEDVVTF
ncbi:hypothetical protein GCM10027443_18020 [Pontibacter brevis]